jgi:MFS family permease
MPQARTSASGEVIETDAPARLDRLPWLKFHGLVVAALGGTWILDGLEVTMVGSLSGAIADRASLGLSGAAMGLTASAYLAGAVAGALFFGGLTDRFGRRPLFAVTLGVYIAATLATGLAWNFWSFALFRFFTGAGIGGEYAAINSAVQEFIPARFRGRTDLAINGSWWIGGAIGAIGSILVLDPHLFAPNTGWRFAFITGGLFGLVILFLRRFVPESPRWLMTHGRVAEAEQVVQDIEDRAGRPLPSEPPARLRLAVTHQLNLAVVARMLFVQYPKRLVLGLTLMASQAFCYNAIFFTYALILTRYYHVAEAKVGWFILPFAIGNFLGPMLLGPLFDTIGRKVMITLTYAVSGVLIIVVGVLFRDGVFNAAEQTAAWSLIFFFASAGASAAYLTVGESFPLEARALTIAIFYAFGTAIGGVAGPVVFGALIDTGSRDNILWGYALGGGLMLAAAVAEVFLGIAAEGRSLEDIAPPISLQPEKPQLDLNQQP